MYCNTFILWQALYPIGYLTLYGLTECIINEWMNEWMASCHWIMGAILRRAQWSQNTGNS
jgi:hypothetical protein